MSTLLKRALVTPYFLPPPFSHSLVGMTVSSLSAKSHKLIGAALLQDLSRVVLVSNGEFSGEAHAAVEKSLPLQIELLDLGGLRRWISRLRGEKLDVETEVGIMLRDLSSGLARLIAKSPDAVDHLEWRMVEQIVAEVFQGLGFVVTLTPGSKDGGKKRHPNVHGEGRT